MSVETITPIVWVVFAGVCCAAFYAFYQKRIVGDLLRALIAAGADCAENAKTARGSFPPCFEKRFGSAKKRRSAGR